MQTLSVQNLISMGTHACNIESATEGFVKAQDEISSTCQRVNEFIDHVPVANADIHNLLASYKSEDSKHKECYKALVINFSLLTLCSIN